MLSLSLTAYETSKLRLISCCRLLPRLKSVGVFGPSEALTVLMMNRSGLVGSDTDACVPNNAAGREPAQASDRRRIGRFTTDIESFNGKLRDELLNLEIFDTLLLEAEDFDRALETGVQPDSTPQFTWLSTASTGGSMGSATVDFTAAGYRKWARDPNIESGLGCGGRSRRPRPCHRLPTGGRSRL